MEVLAELSFWEKVAVGWGLWTVYVLVELFLLWLWPHIIPDLHETREFNSRVRWVVILWLVITAVIIVMVLWTRR